MSFSSKPQKLISHLNGLSEINKQSYLSDTHRVTTLFWSWLRLPIFLSALGPIFKFLYFLSHEGGGGVADSLIKVGTDVRRVQNQGRAKFLQKPAARAKRCPKA